MEEFSLQPEIFKPVDFDATFDYGGRKYALEIKRSDRAGLYVQTPKNPRLALYTWVLYYTLYFFLQIQRCVYLVEVSVSISNNTSENSRLSERCYRNNLALDYTLQFVLISWAHCSKWSAAEKR
jgi:hypothetical protein